MSAEELAAALAARNFLVVDDVGSMRAIAVSQLRQLGAINVFEASNGEDALRMLARQPIHMVLSDWDMPAMSGLELLETVRRDARLRSLPFVMITAEVERGHVQRAIAADVSAFLVKPYSSGRFVERIRQALHWIPRHVAPSTLPAAEKSARQATILAVDDVPDNLQLLLQLLKGDYRVKVATNGEKALAICQGDEPPDLILLDVMMPGMDGFEVLKRLRAHPNSEHIPVIFITAMTDEESRAKGMDLGAVDYVGKPVDPATLRVRIANFMRYVELYRRLQADYDEMLETARLREDVARLSGPEVREALEMAARLARNLAATPDRPAEETEQLRQIETLTGRLLGVVAEAAGADGAGGSEPARRASAARVRLG